MTFKNLNLDNRLVVALNQINIIKPTEIQKKTIRYQLNRKNIIGVAPTGTGKTFAYCLPMLHWLLNTKINHNDPSVLILVPTRELVKQVEHEIKLVTNFTEVNIVTIFAGIRKGKQIRKFENNIIDIVIATPGRLLNLLEENIFKLDKIGILIIDEFDRLFDMGFSVDVEKIETYLPYHKKRQNILFGSTFPNRVKKLLSQFFQLRKGKFEIVDITKNRNLGNIKHLVYEVEDHQKLDALIKILNSIGGQSIIIFTRSIENARITAKNLLKNGIDCEEIHGGLTQRQRSIALSNFSSGDTDIIVATDIIARGIDVDDVLFVISYDTPKLPDDYIHRSGRTGRMHHQGTSIIIVSPVESEAIGRIEARYGFKFKRMHSIVKPQISKSIKKSPLKTNKIKFNRKSYDKKINRKKNIKRKRK